MPRGPNGERRPGDVVGCAVTVAKIATGEIEEELPAKTRRRTEGREGSCRGVDPERRSEIAKSLGTWYNKETLSPIP